MNYELNALRIENDRLMRENQLMKKLSSVDGFYAFYFENLSKFKNQKECFDFVNAEYFRLFNKYRYESYNSFKVVEHQRNKREK